MHLPDPPTALAAAASVLRAPIGGMLEPLSQALADFLPHRTGDMPASNQRRAYPQSMTAMSPLIVYHAAFENLSLSSHAGDEEFDGGLRG
ncbi:hypothetical protein [Nonomuraea sp. JJY05]|uniref:hypothetical protein n=1 Tax=Nonomuraea sp. JJY05 TaxID=3350255 RepID=UPI00373F9F96